MLGTAIRLSFAIGLNALLIVLPAGRGNAEGTEQMTFLGHSIKKTVEFSYYMDVCGDAAGGAHLRKLALRRLAACEATASPGGKLSHEIEDFSAEMVRRVQDCDADANCARGRHDFCPRVQQSGAELGLMMNEADENVTALDRLVGGCG